jgi:F1F0 ATPase subunit 2
MTDPFTLIPALLIGMLLGALFFGGLWWTVRQGLASPRPALWFAGSLLLRLGIVLSGFHVVGGTDWRRMAACLIGFIFARLVVTRWAARITTKEPYHAP